METTTYSNTRQSISLPAPPSVTPESKLDTLLLRLFHAADFYYYIVHLPQADFALISPEMEEILGYPAHTLTMRFFISIIHPDDLPWFICFGKTTAAFYHSLSATQAGCYKVQYDYRIRKSNGCYLRVLHQMLAIEADEAGIPVKTLCVHTDITHLKKEGKPVLSFIGSNGAPSYPDVKAAAAQQSANEPFTRRETEILGLLQEGKDSKQIAGLLFISRATVDTHRKNLLKKAGVQRTTELIAMALKKGWL